MTKHLADGIYDGVLLSLLVLYVVFRAFTVVVIMPLAVGDWELTSVYFLTLLVFSILTTMLAFTTLRGATAISGLLIVVAAFSFWWFVICKRGEPIWSDFKWGVIPEAVFGCAALLRWLFIKRNTAHLKATDTHARP